MPIISAQRIFPKNKGIIEHRYGNMYHFIFDLTKETPEKTKNAIANMLCVQKNWVTENAVIIIKRNEGIHQFLIENK